MSKYHINNQGVPALCRANEGKCPFAEHFPTENEAQKFADEVNSREVGLLPGMNTIGESEATIRMKAIAVEGRFSKLGPELKRLENPKEFAPVNEYIDSIKGSDTLLDNKIANLESEKAYLEKRAKEIDKVGRKRKADELERLTREYREGKPVGKRLKELQSMSKTTVLRTAQEKKELEDIRWEQYSITSDINSCKYLKSNLEITIQDDYREKIAKKNLEGRLEKLEVKPDLKYQVIDEHYDKLKNIEDTIHGNLKGYGGFEKYDISKSGSNIIIRGFHRDVKGYAYADIVEVKSDFSNYKGAVNDFITKWKEKDNEKSVRDYNGFLNQGNKHGWD